MELIRNFKYSGGFFGHYEELIRDVVIPYQERILNDEIDGIEKSHSLENYRLAAEKIETGKCSGKFYGMVFQDSDVAKWLEGAAYSLCLNPDKSLEERCDSVIDLIGRAQEADGYLDTYYTVLCPEKKWTNLEQGHEMYCAGHMIEAAVAYAESTGKEKLLHIMCGMADHIYKRFVSDGTAGFPGHPEIELALVRLYDYTGNNNYLELAGHFVDVRGTDPEFFDREAEKRGWDVWPRGDNPALYNLSYAPVREQTNAEGHAVRAVYLFSGMADVAMATDDDSLRNACRRLWESITKRRLYITGGIGSQYEGESFSEDYDLPNDTAYAETCAAIGLIFFARRMIMMDHDSKYADTMERALYNGVLSGMQLDGTRFFYVNPLESLPGISGECASHKAALAERPQWFPCACCPPNVARLIPSLAEYAWTVDANDRKLYANLYICGELDIGKCLSAGQNCQTGGRVLVETAYPYDGTVKYSFAPEGDEPIRMTLMIRIPGWSRNTTVLRNGKAVDCLVEKGYAQINGPFTANDVIELELDMSVRRVFANTKVSDDSGKCAFARGPLVYCAEGADNDGDVLGLRVKKNAAPHAELFDEDNLSGMVGIDVEGVRIDAADNDALYSDIRPEERDCIIHLIPYYTWNNRGINEMRVWIPEV